MARKNAPLRGLYGIDANTNRVINVERPDDSPTGSLLDAVNLEYFVEKNTVQEFDVTRQYPSGFIISYEDILYVSKWDILDVSTGLGVLPTDVIDQPVDETDSNPWSIIRTDRNWIGVDQSTTYYTEISKFYAVITANFDSLIKLPDASARNMTPGQRVTILDASYNARNKPIRVIPDGTMGIHKNADSTITDTEYFINTNSDNVSFVYDGSNWVAERREVLLYVNINSTDTSQGLSYELSSNELLNVISTSDTYLELPPFPKVGDMVKVNSLANTLLLDDDIIVKVNPSTSHLIDVGKLSQKTANVSSFKFNSKSLISFVYTSSNVWTIFVQDNTNTEIVTSSTQLKGYESVLINTESQNSDITLTLPNDLTHGNFINLSNLYFNENCDITLTCSPNGERGNKFKGDTNNIVFKKYTDADLGADTSSITLDGSIGFNLRIRYVVEPSGDSFFYIENINVRTDFVDYQYNERPATIKLATDQQAVQQEYAPDGKTRANIPVTDHWGTTTNVRYDDHAITPHTLDNRRATDELAGLARVATSAEVNINTVTNSGIGTSIINSGTSGQWSATGNGKLEAQFQYDGSGGTHRDDIFLSPLKLTQRRATDLMSGILETATLTQALAQRNKVISNSDVMDYMGSPLHDKIITPDTLDNRRASETQTGLARLATFNELLSGVDSGSEAELIINPYKFEQWANRTINLETNDVSGLYNAGLGYTDLLNNTVDPISGRSTLWDSLLLDIAVATESQRGTLETATQTEANLQSADASAVGTNNVGTPSDIHIITPKKLDARRATNTQTGLSRLATNSEIDAGTLNNEVVINPHTLTYWLDKTEHIKVNTKNTSTASANTTSDGLYQTGTLWTDVYIDILAATEAQRGTSRFATTNGEVLNQSQQYWDLAVSVQGLDSRRATETQTGLSRIATQAEVDNGILDGGRGSEAFITPLKMKTWLDRYNVLRTTANKDSVAVDGLKIDNTLWDNATITIAGATESQRGTLETATQTETNLQANDASAAGTNNVGTPSDIHIVTPKKLDARRATETQTGLSRLATNSEINAGTLDNEVVINPYTFKYWLNKDEHITSSAANGAIASDGLIVSNNIWEGVDLSITPATESQRGTLQVATQSETNTNGSGTGYDNLIITPKKLNARRASTTLAGIAEIATTTDIDNATDNSQIVTPAMLNRWTKTSSNSKATTSNRGTLEVATNTEQWNGTSYTKPTENEANSGTHNDNIYTPSVSSYVSDKIVTPNGLNNALSNYLPRHATADDSWQLGGNTATYYNNYLSQHDTEIADRVIKEGTTKSVEFTDFIKVGDMTISSANGVASFTFD